MNVLKRLIYGALVAAVATTLAVVFVPQANPVSYVGEIIGAGVIATLVLAAVSFYREDDLTMHDKNVLMNGFLVAILLPSFYTAGAFVHESQTSWSKGEIHYHADYEVLVEQQGELERLNLIDPSQFCEEQGIMCSLNDRTGIKEYHEHNDNRIHLEGVFETREEATLAAFFETFGGKLTDTELVYPTNDGEVSVSEEQGGELKIIVHRGTAGNRHWCAIDEEAPEEELCIDQYNNQKASSPSEYVVSPYKKGPSLDDIYVIYDSSSVTEALEDLRQDDKYRGMGLRKQGEGF